MFVQDEPQHRARDTGGVGDDHSNRRDVGHRKSAFDSADPAPRTTPEASLPSTRGSLWRSTVPRRNPSTATTTTRIIPGNQPMMCSVAGLGLRGQSTSSSLEL